MRLTDAKKIRTYTYISQSGSKVSRFLLTKTNNIVLISCKYYYKYYYNGNRNITISIIF